MRYVVPLIILLALLPGLSFNHLKTEKDIDETKALQVVELFTSQGCSSCPAADQLLSTVADKKM